MKEYTFIVSNRYGKRIGKIEFGKRADLPTHAEISKAVKETFPSGSTYRLAVNL